jgi:hypothetical protein
MKRCNATINPQQAVFREFRLCGVAEFGTFGIEAGSCLR